MKTEKQPVDASKDGKGGSKDSGEFSIDLLAVLSRRFGLILASGVFGIIAGAAYLFLVPPKYESRAQILLMQDEAASLATEGQTGDNTLTEDLLATHMSLLQSKRLVRNALTNSQLDTLPSIVEKLDEETTAIEYVIDNLYVTRGGEGAARDARVLSVAFRHSDPNDCQLVSQALVAEYQKFVKNEFSDREVADNDDNTELLLNKARTGLEEEIAQESAAYRKFLQDAPLLASTEGGANVHALRYEELSAELSQVDLQIEESKSRVKLVKEGLARMEGTEGPQLQKLALIDEKNAERLGILVTVERGEAQTASFQALQPERMAGAQAEYSSLLALKAKLKQAEEDFGPRHPEVKTLEIQVAEMESFMKGREAILGVQDDQAPLTPDDIMAAYVALLENDLLGLQVRRDDILKQKDASEKAAKELMEYEILDMEHQKRIVRLEDLYTSVVERIRDINLSESVSPIIQEVIEDPELGEKVTPNAPIALAIAMLTSMLLAGSTVLVAELSDKSIHTADDIENIYGAKVLSTVPDFERDAETRLTMKKVAKTRPTIDPQVIAFHDPKSRISESFRGIRTQLLFNLSSKDRVFMVTSPTQGEGKSTTIANLAVSLAGTGKRVVLVDCDMRRPRVASIFGLTSDVGVSNLLVGTATLKEAVQETAIENLAILTCGKSTDNPAELLAQPAFERMLDSLRQEYDVVMVDCPPLLPVADPAIVARHVDGVVIVTTIGPDGAPKANKATRILATTGARVIGVVINKSGTKGFGYGDDEYGYSANYVATSAK